MVGPENPFEAAGSTPPAAANLGAPVVSTVELSPQQLQFLETQHDALVGGYNDAARETTLSGNREDFLDSSDYYTRVTVSERIPESSFIPEDQKSAYAAMTMMFAGALPYEASSGHMTNETWRTGLFDEQAQQIITDIVAHVTTVRHEPYDAPKVAATTVDNAITRHLTQLVGAKQLTPVLEAALLAYRVGATLEDPELSVKYLSQFTQKYQQEPQSPLPGSWNEVFAADNADANDQASPPTLG